MGIKKLRLNFQNMVLACIAQTAQIIGGRFEMKCKKVMVVLLTATCISLSGGLGYFMGQANQGKSDMKQTVVIADEIENKQQESRKIAVVNLDEGVMVKDTVINYAEKTTKFPDTDFEYSSLEEARTGLKTGKYGAYIIIPADFSQNVESLNGTPQVSQLEYAMNRSLSGLSQYELLYKIVSYTESLNDSLSYMYLNSILNEFHDAQDGAINVMSNDLRDKDAIDRIAASDLVALIEMPEIVREENSIEALDFAVYTEKNSKLAKSIDEQYIKCVEEIEKGIEELSENGNTLGSILTAVSDKVGEIDVTIDAEGNSIADIADTKLGDSLNAYIDQVPDKQTLINEWKKVNENLTEIKNGWENANRVNSNKANKQLEDVLETYLDELKGKVPVMTFIEKDDGSYQVTFQQTGTEIPPSILFSIVDVSGNPYQELLKEISDALVQSVGETEKILIPIEVPESAPGVGDGYVMTVEYDVPMSVDSVLKKYDGQAQGLGYSSATAFLLEFSHGKVDALVSTQKKIQCSSTDWSSFTDYINGCLEDVDYKKYQINDITDLLYDEHGSVETDINGDEIYGFDRMEEETRKIIEMIESLENTPALNVENIKQLVQDEYVTPITKNAENAKSIFQQRYEDEKNSISEYNEVLKAFSPVINSEFIDQNVAEMIENNTSLQKELTENSTTSMEYVNKVYQSTEENVRNLQKAITDAKENSDHAVADGLNEAKNVKAETSRVNQEILKDFSEKLPYTRLGSMGYIQAYQFITKPIALNDISEEKEVSVKSVSEYKERGEAITTYLIYIVFSGFLVVAFIIFIMLRCFRNKKLEQ